MHSGPLAKRPRLPPEHQEQDDEVASMNHDDSQRKDNFSVMASQSATLSSSPNGVVRKTAVKSAGAPGAKKLVIKNLKPKPVLPDQFETRAVEKLRRAVVAIQKAQSIDTSLEELYAAVENLCSHGFADKVRTNSQVDLSSV